MVLGYVVRADKWDPAGTGFWAKMDMDILYEFSYIYIWGWLRQICPSHGRGNHAPGNVLLHLLAWALSFSQHTNKQGCGGDDILKHRTHYTLWCPVPLTLAFLGQMWRGLGWKSWGGCLGRVLTLGPAKAWTLYDDFCLHLNTFGHILGIFDWNWAHFDNFWHNRMSLDIFKWI